MRYKRRWAWKEKHVRKHFSLSYQSRWAGPDVWFRQDLHKGDRQKELLDCKRIMRGEEDVDTSPKYHPHEGRWLWS